jgi:hypothetical protein
LSPFDNTGGAVARYKKTKNLSPSDNVADAVESCQENKIERLEQLDDIEYDAVQINKKKRIETLAPDDSDVATPVSLEASFPVAFDCEDAIQWDEMHRDLCDEYVFP